MRNRYYIIFVAREQDGRVRKIPIPLHYAYVFVAAAVVGAFTITGMAGSYSRMLLKTSHFNEVRSQREAIRKDYLQMEQVAHQKDVQAASLGSLASEVSAPLRTYPKQIECFQAGGGHDSGRSRRNGFR